MTRDEFITHACEQVLRFTQVDKWDDLTEALKVQLGFNLGVVALGLDLTKAEGYQALANARDNLISMRELRDHLRLLIVAHHIEVDETKIVKPF